MPNLLFIPFTVAENNFSLYLRALEWRYALKQVNAFPEKIPEIVIYREANEKNEDYDGYDVQFVFNEKNCSQNTTLYILADGTGDPTEVGNINSYFEKMRETPYFISVEMIAKRLKQCGLDANLAKNLKAIKLFICDENNTNEQLAINFAHELGKDYTTLTLHYYNARIFVPQVTEENPKAKKRGEVYFTQSNGKQQLIDSDFASEYRFALTVEEALQHKKSEISPEVDLKPLSFQIESVIAEDSSLEEGLEEGIEENNSSHYQIEYPPDEPDYLPQVSSPTISVCESQQTQLVVYSPQPIWHYKRISFFSSVSQKDLSLLITEIENFRLD